jgi:hypothetical protein
MNRGEEDYDQGRTAFQLCAIDSRRRFPTIRSETYAFINTYEMTDGRLKLDCGLIHKIIEGFFAKCLKEEPNHGTSALFIIRDRKFARALQRVKKSTIGWKTLMQP